MEVAKDGTPVQKIEYRYDSVGKQIAEIYSSREATLTYDAFDRVTGKSLNDPTGKLKMEVIIRYDPPYESTKYFKPDGQVDKKIKTDNFVSIQRNGLLFQKTTMGDLN
ncbi:MAG: hypothetical protein WDO15_19805 [Bacteroidota bacterium]